MIPGTSLGGFSRGTTEAPVSLWVSGALSSSSSGQTTVNPQQRQQQRRWNYQYFLGKYYDPATGKWKYEDWSPAIRAFKEPTVGGNRIPLVALDWINKEHVKPTVYNKMLKSEKVYNRKMKQIADLAHYIKFRKQYDK
jgi:hypothetical protein